MYPLPIDGGAGERRPAVRGKRTSASHDIYYMINLTYFTRFAYLYKVQLPKLVYSVIGASMISAFVS